MTRISRPRALTLMVSLLLLSAGSVGLAAPARAATGGCSSTGPKITVTFTSADVVPIRVWTVADWVNELTSMKQSCITGIVLTSTAAFDVETNSTTDLFGPARPSGTSDVPANLLAAADRVGGLSVYLGLERESGWENDVTSTWAAAAARRSAATARAVLTDLPSHGSLKGWFLTPEPEPGVLRTTALQQVFESYLSAAANSVSALLPSAAQIIVAPAYNTWMPASTFTSMMSILAANPRVTALALQDRTGESDEDVTSPAIVAQWFARAHSALAGAPSAPALWSDTENYTTTDWTPQTVRQVSAYIAAESPYVSAVGTFSYSSYYSAKGWFPAYAAPYATFAATGALPSYVPTTPALTVKPVNGLDAQLSWTAATDQPSTGFIAGINSYRLLRRDPTHAARLVATVLASQTSTGCAPKAAYCVTDTQLQPGVSYTYQIQAVNAVGNPSPSTSGGLVQLTEPPLAGADDLAIGAGYTMSPTPSSSYPDSGHEITDGVLGPVNDQNPEWAGWNTGNPVVTIDLGATESPTAVTTTWLQQIGPGVLTPASVSAATSLNGTTWTPAPFASPRPRLTGDDQAVTFATLLAAGTIARYVRITAINPGSWLFLSEIAVHGPAREVPGYVVGRPPATSYPDAGQELLDGLVGSQAAPPIDSHWVGWWQPDGLRIDLTTASARTVSGVTASCLTLASWGIRCPAGLVVSTSVDGAAYRPVAGSVMSTATGSVTASFTPVAARYLRISIAATGVQWVMLSEILLQ